MMSLKRAADEDSVPATDTDDHESKRAKLNVASSPDDDKPSEKSNGAVSSSVKNADVVDDIECSEELQMSFPERLMDLLQNGKDVATAMKWLPNGEAFTLVPSIFYDVVLDGHFHGTKFESFTRKLNRWGFKRLSNKGLPKDCIAYHHVLFKKDRPELLSKMRSGRNRHVFQVEEKPTSKKTASSSSGHKNVATSINNHPPMGSGDVNPLMQARPSPFSSAAGSTLARLGGGNASAGPMVPAHIEADMVLRRRLDEAMRSQQRKNSGFASTPDSLMSLRRGGGSFLPQQHQGGIDPLLGNAPGNSSGNLIMQRLKAARQQQQQQSFPSYDSLMMGGCGVDPLKGCGPTDSSYFGGHQDHGNQAPHLVAMRQLLVDQRAAARATEDSLRLHQLVYQGNNNTGGGGGLMASDFVGSSNNNNGIISSNSNSMSNPQDAKLYQLMRLREQLDMVTRNS